LIGNANNNWEGINYNPNANKDDESCIENSTKQTDKKKEEFYKAVER